jgi:hypothetical protein
LLVLRPSQDPPLMLHLSHHQHGHRFPQRRKGK